MPAASFQSSVRTVQGFGVVGELFSDAPKVCQPGVVDDAGANIIGYAFTQTAIEGVMTVGGSGFFAGILVNPKSYALRGDGVNPLNPSMELAANSVAEFLQQGEIIIQVPAACNIGDDVLYTLADGSLLTIPRGTAYDDALYAPAYGTITRFIPNAVGVQLAVAMFTFPTEIPAIAP